MLLLSDNRKRRQGGLGPILFGGFLFPAHDDHDDAHEGEHAGDDADGVGVVGGGGFGCFLEQP